VVSVCPHCRAAVARKGVDLEAIGQVAELVATSSPFRLGLGAKPKKGIKPFTFVGRLQLSTGEGTWDEWHIAFADGSYGWLAETQGEFYLMLPVKPPEVPEFSQIQPAMRLDLGAYGVFVVIDRRQALYASAEGELPFRSPPGSVFMYADLSGADGSLATLDYGDDPGLDAFYVGRKVDLADLNVEGAASWDVRTVAAKSASLNCPSCGGALTLKDPVGTKSMACTHCGSILWAKDSGKDAGKFAVLEKLSEPPFVPDVPLGAEGVLEGRKVVVLGALRKACEVDGTWYYWKEYLLKEGTTEAYLWLVESNGHWSFVTPVAAGTVSEVGRSATFGGKKYKHFQKSQAVVEAVLGEFYWQVRKGETTTASDYIAPPRILSEEISGTEATWSEGTYLQKEAVEQAFGLKTPLPAPEGVGANQPWPRADDARAVARIAGIMAVVTTVLFIAFTLAFPRAIVFDSEQTILGPPSDSTLDTGAAGGHAPEKTDDKVFLSEPFEIPHSGNIEAHIDAPTDNTWVAVGVSLIEETTGESQSFGLVSDYYHGVDDGESWSEGARHRNVYLSQVPKGRYVLRLEPEFEPRNAPVGYHVTLRSGVTHFGRFILMLFLLTLGPLAMGFSYVRFESRRWAESDYASGSSSSTSSSSESSGSDE
jgi:Domain of unknown function (DUF4178)